MSSSNSGSNEGTSILTVLLIIFIVLKLCKVITWSWWLVFTPLWIELGVTAIVLIVFYTLGGCKPKRKGSDKIKW